MRSDATVECPEVEVVRDTGLVLVCRVGDRQVMIPPMHMLPGTTVRRPGDRGRLVLPRWFAAEIGVEHACASGNDAR
jgi:hypothetical protein